MCRVDKQASAIQAWKVIENGSLKLYSSEHVFDETLSLLSRSASYNFAAEWGQSCFRSGEFEWLSTSDDDVELSLEFMRKYADQKVSFTDCISFALMRREGIRDVFSFDHHFQRAHFHLWPRG